MARKTTALGLSINQLKLIALVLMTIDHVGAYLLPQYTVLRLVGRLSMPIFAWAIAEGCYYTKNRLRYLLTIALFAAVCQVIYMIFLEPYYQCILVTFSLSVIMIYAVDLASKKQNVLTLALMGAVFCGVVYVCSFLPNDLPGLNYRIDYGLLGVLLPVLIYMGRNKSEKLLLAAVGLTALALTTNSSQWYALLSLPLLALYNGKKGKMKLKYLFYLYYPLHLVAICAIAMLLNH